MTAPLPAGATSARDPTAKNVTLLAICQGLAMSASSLTFTIMALVGYSLAEDKAYATLPIALQFLASTLTTIPASLIMRRLGRRVGLSIGAAIGVASGLVSAKAVFDASFPLLCLGGALYGVANAHAFYYRFAAADTASEAFKARAISLVLAGGVVAGFLGPQLAVWTQDLFAPVLFAGGFVALTGLSVLALAVLQFIEIPRMSASERREGGRPLLQIARTPVFLVAALAGMTGYGAMNLVMTSTPLAIIACNHPFEAAALVIQWHVVAMYLPSFVTGKLIDRFGWGRIIGLGALLILGCVLVNLSGQSVWQFWSALVLLGVGWNFMFVGGTALLTEAYRPAEKAKVQALNDFLVFGTVACTALASGQLFDGLGWQAVNLSVVVPILMAIAGVVWLSRQRVPQPAE